MRYFETFIELVKSAFTSKKRNEIAAYLIMIPIYVTLIVISIVCALSPWSLLALFMGVIFMLLNIIDVILYTLKFRIVKSILHSILAALFLGCVILI